jgi:hypothetical protein
MVSFTPRPLYPRGKSPRYPLDRRRGGPGTGLNDVEKRQFLILLGLELQSLRCLARSQLLFLLCYPGSTCDQTEGNGLPSVSEFVNVGCYNFDSRA